MSTSRNSRTIVVLDTNMLILMASGVPLLDYIEESLETKPEYVVLKPVYDELLKISNKEGSLDAKRALFAIKIVEEYCKVLPYDIGGQESVDDAIIKFAVENKAIVATNDRALRTRLRELGVPEAYFREESRRIVIEGYYK
ncbi:MAG: PIN domain-containing protein [Desulfurococcaceae archaeon]